MERVVENRLQDRVNLSMSGGRQNETTNTALGVGGL